MTFREKLADWISGGALTLCRLQESSAETARQLMHEYADRLDRIAAEEKPTSNATVKRMARIARGEE